MRYMALEDVPLGKVFMKDYNVYMRIQDIPQVKKQYPDSACVLNMDTYKVMIMNEHYTVELMDTIEEEEENE